MREHLFCDKMAPLGPPAQGERLLPAHSSIVLFGPCGSINVRALSDGGQVSMIGQRIPVTVPGGGEIDLIKHPMSDARRFPGGRLRTRTEKERVKSVSAQPATRDAGQNEEQPGRARVREERRARGAGDDLRSWRGDPARSHDCAPKAIGRDPAVVRLCSRCADLDHTMICGRRPGRTDAVGLAGIDRTSS